MFVNAEFSKRLFARSQIKIEAQFVELGSK